uniref:Serine aminopeptidase S33 domain-containing protein n=1 Tax=Ananas comosus var. bracteatus TaxID=296719 RepID=A0A6V7PQ23_ANACO|nr:unnamed protein product [Ananas comosus var. bracteatus]
MLVRVAPYKLATPDIAIAIHIRRADWRRSGLPWARLIPKNDGGSVDEALGAVDVGVGRERAPQRPRLPPPPPPRRGALRAPPVPAMAEVRALLVLAVVGGGCGEEGAAVSTSGGGGGGGGKKGGAAAATVVVRVPAAMVAKRRQREQEAAARRAAAVRRVRAAAEREEGRCRRDFALMGTARGETLFTQSWAPLHVKTKGLLVLLHGLNEHSGRYDHFARN